MHTKPFTQSLEHQLCFIIVSCCITRKQKTQIESKNETLVKYKIQDPGCVQEWELLLDGKLVSKNPSSVENFSEVYGFNALLSKQ